MAIRRRNKVRQKRGHLGVWDPTGGESREGSGLPVEYGQEEIRILAALEDGQVGKIAPEELEVVLDEPGTTLWIDLMRPGHSSRKILEDVLQLNPLTVEDCLSPLRMPKMDVFPENAFVAAFAARLAGEPWRQLRAIEVDLVVGGNYLVTVRDTPVPEVSERLERKIRDGVADEDVSTGGMLAYEAMDALVDGHLPVLVGAASAAEDLEESLDPGNERASANALENLISLRRDLQAFRRLAVAQQESLRRLGRVSPGLRVYLSDASDNQREAVDMVEASRDYVEGAIEAYRMRRDERSELGIRRLTVLAAVLGPLTVLAGWYGMNFSYLPGAESVLAFWLFILVQVAFVVGAIWYLRRRGLF
ncbi:MAG: magnesium transporter CorA family protein [Rubrobacteraceae bacterium]